MQFTQQPVNAMGAMQNEYANNSAQNSSTMSALGSLGSSMMFYSSKDFKDDIRPAPRLLDRLDGLPVDVWRYKPGVGSTDPMHLHIGPYAEDMREFLGFGMSDRINAQDAIGALFVLVKELKAEVVALKGTAS